MFISAVIPPPCGGVCMHSTAALQRCIEAAVLVDPDCLVPADMHLICHMVQHAGLCIP